MQPIKSIKSNEIKPTTGYSWLVVLLLGLAYMVSFVDRMIINLMVDPIRADLNISDTEMSFLMGFSFALFYTLLGLPIARLADQKNRKTIITIGIMFWSIMTALCGFSRTYWILFLARMGVGVGEASLSPAAYSMIADYFPKEKVGRAISVYSMGIYIGAGAAFIFGSMVISAFSDMKEVILPLLGSFRPWQVTFFIVSLPGIIIVVLFLLFLREPERKTTPTSSNNPTPSLSGLVDFLRLNRKVVLSHLTAFSLLTIVSHGSMAWLPSFLIRTHEFPMEKVGIYIGVIFMVFGMSGTFFGAWLAEKLEEKGHKDAIFRVVLIGSFVLLPVVCLLPFLDKNWVIICISAFIFLISMPWGIAPAALQLITPYRYRAQLSALYLFAINLIGLGFGPTVIALLTDNYFRDEMAVGYSLALTCLIALFGAILALIWGIKSYRLALNSMTYQE